MFFETTDMVEGGLEDDQWNVWWGFAQSATTSFFLRPSGELEIIGERLQFRSSPCTATAVQFKARLQKPGKFPENIP